MSSYGTHMLIGGAGGLTLATALERLDPDLLIIFPGYPCPGYTPYPPGDLIPCGAWGLAIIGASAYLALLPDLDEPGSYLSRRVHAAIMLLGMLLGVGLAVLAGLPPLVWGVGLLGGAGAGHGAGRLLLRSIRVGAGGHRRLTHSLVLAGAALLIAGAIGWLGSGWWALLPGALAYGILLHDIGDVVTPAGVPLLWPFSATDVRILPHVVAKHLGEPLVAGMAVAWSAALVFVF